jgi:hypothetical protein
MVLINYPPADRLLWLIGRGSGLVVSLVISWDQFAFLAAKHDSAAETGINRYIMKSAAEICWVDYTHATVSVLLTQFSVGVFILLLFQCVGLIGPIRW